MNFIFSEASVVPPMKRGSSLVPRCTAFYNRKSSAREREKTVDRAVEDKEEEEEKSFWGCHNLLCFIFAFLAAKCSHTTVNGQRCLSGIHQQLGHQQTDQTLHSILRNCNSRCKVLNLRVSSAKNSFEDFWTNTPGQRTS